MKNDQLTRNLIAGLLAALFVFHTLDVVRLPFISSLDNFLYDVQLNRTLPLERDERIVILDIDEKSIEKLGRWPWGRDIIAGLTSKLIDEYYASVVAFDVLFSEKDHTTGVEILDQLDKTTVGANPGYRQLSAKMRLSLDKDKKFEESMMDRPVILGFFFDDTIKKNVLPTPLSIEDARLDYLPIDEAHGYGGNLEQFQRAAFGGGFVDRPVFDDDGLIRRVRMLMRYQGAVYPSLSLAVLQALGLSQPELSMYGDLSSPDNISLEMISLGAMKIPVDSGASVHVPYRHPKAGFRYVSVIDVLENLVKPEILDGAIVLVGSRAAGMLDLRPTPVAQIFPGVEIHANVISAALDNRFKQAPDFFAIVDASFILLCALVVSFISIKYGALVNISAVVALEILVFSAAIIFWDAGYILRPAGPAVFVFALFSLNIAFSYVIEQRNKRKLADAFGHYVPTALVDKMSGDPDQYTMEGESKNLTVLFSDIRGFTGISEKLSPAELSRLMHIYLSDMTRAVHDQSGTIDKYIGDAIMAFWGAPVELENHAQNAVLCAVAMQLKLPEVNERLESEGLPSLSIGIGLNSGLMSVGNMGSEFRTAYTVLGDAVNLASRLEGMCKKYGVGIVISNDTRQHLTDIPVRYLDRVRVVGKKTPVLLYEPIALNNEGARSRAKELEAWKTCMRFYLSQNWPQAFKYAAALVKAFPQDELYLLYKKRIAAYVKNPPSEDWDGVFVYTSK